MDWKAAKVATLVLGLVLAGIGLAIFLVVYHPMFLARLTIGATIVMLWLAVYYIYRSNRDNTLW